MSYKARKRARKFFWYLSVFGSIGFFGSFIYILSLAGMSDMASRGYADSFGIKSLVIHGLLAFVVMFISIVASRFGAYGFDIQDSWVKYIRRKKHGHR